MRASYRRHVLWRSLTRTRYLLAAALVISTVVVSFDHHTRPQNCTWYYDHSTPRLVVGKCIPNGERPPFLWTRIP